MNTQKGLFNLLKLSTILLANISIWVFFHQVWYVCHCQGKFESDSFHHLGCFLLENNCGWCCNIIDVFAIFVDFCRPSRVLAFCSLHDYFMRSAINQNKFWKLGLHSANACLCWMLCAIVLWQHTLFSFYEVNIIFNSIICMWVLNTWVLVLTYQKVCHWFTYLKIFQWAGMDGSTITKLTKSLHWLLRSYPKLCFLWVSIQVVQDFACLLTIQMQAQATLM